MDPYKVLESLGHHYNLTLSDIKKIDKIIKPIYKHKEFRRRLTKEFLHHSDITLGEHILADTIVTYKLCKKSKKEVDIDTALIIAMMHDLYTKQWQNSIENKNKKFLNKHGFNHPLEAIINAINWYPEYFKDIDKANIIIDGVIHHMYPLPVRVFNPTNNNMELNNYELIKNIDKNLLDIMIRSTSRKRRGKISISRSKYIEGRILSKADKKVSIRQIKNVRSAKALVTGKNNSLKK